ncbi:MAG: hypothetical protein U0T75_06445 [Chitinophagales bacterium]
MKKTIFITTIACLALGIGACKKCYVCYGRHTYSAGGIGYKTKERIRICSDKIKNNDEMEYVKAYYESDGYSCHLLTSGI